MSGPGGPNFCLASRPRILSLDSKSGRFCLEQRHSKRPIRNGHKLPAWTTIELIPSARVASSTCGHFGLAGEVTLGRRRLRSPEWHLAVCVRHKTRAQSAGGRRQEENNKWKRNRILCVNLCGVSRPARPPIINCELLPVSVSVPVFVCRVQAQYKHTGELTHSGATSDPFDGLDLALSLLIIVPTPSTGTQCKELFGINLKWPPQ